MATPNQIPSGNGQIAVPVNREPVGKESVRETGAKELNELRLAGAQLASEQRIQSEKGRAIALEGRWKDAEQTISAAMECLRAAVARGEQLSKWQREMYDSGEILRLALENTESSLEKSKAVPHVESGSGESLPRAFVAVRQFFDLTQYEFEFGKFAAFVRAFQEKAAFDLAEDWLLVPFAQLILLDHMRGMLDRLQIVQRMARKGAEGEGSAITTALESLGRISEILPEELLSGTSDIDRILRSDPARAYARMDFDSRQAYCNAVAELAEKSPLSEREVAEKAIELARAPQSAGTKRGAERRSHVGFYLVGDGKKTLGDAIQYKRSWADRFHTRVLQSADLIYLTAIELVTIGVIALILVASRGKLPSFVELLLFVLPAVECAVATVNILATQMVAPKALPKLDFSKGIPEACATVVAVPTLLISEEQTRKAVNDLEVRYLANRDANLHFALLTDPPDSVRQFDEKDKLGALCSALIQKLNCKYAGERQGTFFHFHRNRTYNSVEKVWMGWERKRGKLLDFNKFLLGQGDSFSLETGNMQALQKVKYVITLDADTQLPRDTARKLVGAIAHPLNRAVVDPATNTVVEGYGILQPRVEISISSASRSRLAAIFSGDTGFDIYAKAVSDVYQDLFGEGIFTGKGIYEVEVFQQTLEHRFPCNALLSHDLIEGAYARAGLLSDVEIVDDYPSHFSAYSRRKHRWVRGDWQIIFWLLPRVPNYFGKIVRNPLNLVSRWKIIDNLRRSVSEFATFILLMGIWLFFPPREAAYWTVAAVLLIGFPTYFQTLVSITRAGKARFTRAFWKTLGAEFISANERLFFRITFLCHQGFVTMDAVVRTLIRLTITHQKLLEWETAAEAEIAANRKKSPVETYLDWMPLLSFGLAVLILAARPESFWMAAPFLALWASAKTICHWLSRPYHSAREQGAPEKALLRRAALRTWRFFREHSNEQENWLIPDIVQEHAPTIAHQISTTNLGFLLNARLAAYDFGYMTLPEMASTTQKTFDTVQRLARFRGHLYNWYHTQTLEPLTPRFVSTVDNGNLVCSLWTLKQGCLEAIGTPIFRENFWSGLEDYMDAVADSVKEGVEGARVGARIREMKARVQARQGSEAMWVDILRGLEVDGAILQRDVSQMETSDEGKWWSHELVQRMSHLSRMVQDFAPWVLPEISKYLRAFDISMENVPLKSLTLLSAADMNARLIGQLDEFLSREDIDKDTRETAETVRERLRTSAALCREMATKLEKIAATSEALAKEMDFSFLYDNRKQLLTIGYDAERECLPDYHYDLFASEARTGVFAAVAKGEIPQETWLRLRRPYAAYGNTPVVLSWTGTMFEYLLPKLWMKSYSNTMLERSSRGALRAQQKFTKVARVPWGISESSCLDKNPDGFYRYHAFGVPGLSLNAANSRELVISPYSSFLGLLVDEASATKNLKQMEQMGCVGPLGYYEAIDFTPSRVGEGKKFEIVKCWMAHHQGMNMLALANVLLGAPMQRRFHAEPLVQATERLLHEKFPRMSKLEKAEKAQVTARQILRAQQGRPAGAKLLFAWIHRARKDEAEKTGLAGNLAAEHHRSDS